MKKRIISVRTLLSGILTLLGFSGCENSEEIPMAYGMPTVNYRVVGEVTDESGNPLQGIQIIVKDQGLLSKDGDYKTTFTHKGDTIYTDSQGVFESAKIKSTGINKQEVIFNDVDGEANGGEFESVKMPLKDLNSKQTEEGGEWYKGDFEFSTKVQMKKK